MRTRRTLAVLACSTGLVLAGCGDNGGDGAGGEGSDLEAFCELNAELGNQVDAPSEEQLDRIVALAPAEIRPAVETLADAVRDDPELDEVLDDPAVVAAGEALDEFEQENCDDE